MDENQLKFIKKIIKSSIIINKYLEDYLKEDIDQIIEDYELDSNEEIHEDELPHVIGYQMTYDDNIQVIINFFDECSESGIGLEYKDVNLTDFINWLSENY